MLAGYYVSICLSVCLPVCLSVYLSSYPQRNIRVYLSKSVAYKTLVRLQLEYASTVWSPYTVTDIHKVEAVQRRAARWATCDYWYTSSVTAIMKDLNWRPLEQCRIDSHLVMRYKITYDFVAIPASEYLTCNIRSSAHNHFLHINRFSLAQIITSIYFPKDYYALECSTCQYSNPSHPGAV